MQKHNFILNSIKNNNHIFYDCLDSPSLIVISYKYPMLVSRPKHGKSYETTSTNYLRNTSGLPCCSEKQGIAKLRVTVNKLFKELSEFINTEVQ